MKDLLNIIPDKSHTFSKAYHQYPLDLSPTYAKKAYGCTLETDLGPYIDWSMGVGPVIKGYAFKDMDSFIFKRMRNGLALSIPYEYEFEVAKKLLNKIEFGEQVRFARNGSDVTSAAVRLARHHTKRNKVICNGYHGWQDWFIGSTTRNSGVPDATSKFTIKINSFSSNELEEAFKKHKNDLACLILEPMIGDEPSLEFLRLAKKLCEGNNTLLIFDECWTGFRCDRRGAIGYTGIKPDLACYAKALGNGVPVSAIVGNRKIMSGFEEAFFSFTHAADPIGLSAADFMLDYLDDDFFKLLRKKTKAMHEKISFILEKIQDENLKVNCTSYPGKIVFSSQKALNALSLKTFFQMEFLKKNMLFNFFIAVCEDHSDKEINLCYEALESCVKKRNSKEFDLVKETKNHLVKAVFRPQK